MVNHTTLWEQIYPLKHKEVQSSIGNTADLVVNNTVFQLIRLTWIIQNLLIFQTNKNKQQNQLMTNKQDTSDMEKMLFT